MAGPEQIQDDEVVFRHIPGDKDHLAEGPRATSGNFELRDGEHGISVTRAAITTAGQLMTRLGDPAAGSRIAAASVRELRALGLEVVSAPIPEDPGHAEIRPGAVNLGSRSLRRKVAKLFAVLPKSATGADPT